MNFIISINDRLSTQKTQVLIVGAGPTGLSMAIQLVLYNIDFIIAGDAAHIHTPAGGQGMNTGIQDAYNLAWKMALTLQGKVNDVLLVSYSIEREQNARNLLNATDKMFDMMSGSNFFWNFFRLQIFPLIAGFVVKNKLIRKSIFPLLSQTGITYNNSPLTIKSRVANIYAGVRMPYFVFKNGKNIFEFINEPCFKVLFFGDDEKADLQNISPHSLVVTKFAFTEILAQSLRRRKIFTFYCAPIITLLISAPI